MSDRDEIVDQQSLGEDLEDARELDLAVERNGNQPLIPWDEAKADLGL